MCTAPWATDRSEDEANRVIDDNNESEVWGDEVQEVARR